MSNLIVAVNKYEGPVGDAYCVLVVKDMIIAGGHDKNIYIWDMNTTNLKYTLKDDGHEHSVKDLNYIEHKNDIILVSGSWDNTVKLWSLSKGILLSTLIGHTNRVRAIAVGVLL